MHDYELRGWVNRLNEAKPGDFFYGCGFAQYAEAGDSGTKAWFDGALVFTCQTPQRWTLAYRTQSAPHQEVTPTGIICILAPREQFKVTEPDGKSSERLEVRLQGEPARILTFQPKGALLA